jgi:hypothetical protein
LGQKSRVRRSHERPLRKLSCACQDWKQEYHGAMQPTIGTTRIISARIGFRLALLIGSGVLWAACTCVVAADAGSTGEPALPKRIVIPKLEGAITVDGDLTEPVWSRAAVLTPFHKNDGSRPEREPTQLRLWYDDTALYLGWTCHDSDIEATFKARDSKFWEEEVVEFFVTPKDLTRYFELQWNPLGGVFDAIISNQLDEQGMSRRYQGDWSFTAKGMKSAVKVRGTVAKPDDNDEFWQVEVMVPFADLGRNCPKPGETWRGNFYRFNRGNGLPVEEVSWSPTRTPSFHQPSRFGYLEFAGEAAPLRMQR